MSIPNITEPMNSTGKKTLEPTIQSSKELKDQFMTLLVAQMQHQNPLNPTDGTEFISQLAQLAQLTSSQKMVEATNKNTVLMENMQALAQANLVGQKVMVETNKLESGTETYDARLTLENASAAVTVYLKDKFDKEYKLALGQQEAGTVNFTLDPKELGMPPGQYTLTVVTGTGEEAKTIPLELAGTVNNVRISNGRQPRLNVSGLGDVSFNKISQLGSSVKTPGSVPVAA
ncbi:flagellar hook capping FlgD N-terminal domain-containing protein [Candidatus Fukatsuia symbiotica]|uniref:Basal-body rod modification protein FlgD n=1 Tax=Candidatus Fukatsuia symbiotica TaxID=1878942 RepID=A0A2U8I692_9GAMM|nr:flagellar hook capping FlgD N-terminal domain-containing protein [Candidatus Fukatsuia symbiotica]AWK14617.1 hypothetical protein CCS41_09255 [Candidatus Fukatsuia symbiotica]MEA9444929.1 flagellar hook capping FlgD N-terminal domain-containing protein [Candidatus Fukatsuia symbiotica]